MIKINDDIFNSLEWEKIKVTPKKTASIFKGNTKILGTEIVGEGLPEAEGLIFYLDNGDDYIEAIEICSGEMLEDELYGFIEIRKAKIKKSEVLIND